MRQSEEILGLRQPLAWFANEMEKQLQANDDKSGWQGITLDWLLHRLRQEVSELERAIEKRQNVAQEAADVANFAMMIADNFTDAEEA